MGLCVVVKEDQRIEVFREFHMIVPLRGASILGKQGHDIWVAMPVSNMAGIQDTCWTWLHACPGCFFFFFFEKWWTLWDTVGTRLGPKKKSWKPKMHLSCRSPPLSSSSSSSCVISSLFFLFFFFLSCDLLPFLSPLMQSLLLLLLIAQARSISPLQFSPFAIFPCFVCVAFFIFSVTHWHTREAFISTHPRE